MEPPTIACVLKSGGAYNIAHVHRLYGQLTRHVRGGFRFTVLTDTPEHSMLAWDVRALQDNLPGWWSKIELFRELPSAFYLDLDTTVCGDVTQIVQPTLGFQALRDFGNPRGMGSGVMAWGPGHSHLYHRFMEDPEFYMLRYTAASRWGDQGYIQDALRPHEFEPLQDRWPGQIRSWKFDVSTHGMTPATRIICFHGKPRPWEVIGHG